MIAGRRFSFGARGRAGMRRQRLRVEVRLDGELQKANVFCHFIHGCGP